MNRKFCKTLLWSITILFLLAGVSEVIFPNNSVFKTCILFLPSIGTFVAGYYFGSLKKQG